MAKEVILGLLGTLFVISPAVTLYLSLGGVLPWWVAGINWLLAAAGFAYAILGHGKKRKVEVEF